MLIPKALTECGEEIVDSSNAWYIRHLNERRNERTNEGYGFCQANWQRTPMPQLAFEEDLNKWKKRLPRKNPTISSSRLEPWRFIIEGRFSALRRQRRGRGRRQHWRRVDSDVVDAASATLKGPKQPRFKPEQDSQVGDVQSLSFPPLCARLQFKSVQAVQSKSTKPFG